MQYVLIPEPEGVQCESESSEPPLPSFPPPIPYLSPAFRGATIQYPSQTITTHKKSNLRFYRSISVGNRGTTDLRWDVVGDRGLFVSNRGLAADFGVFVKPCYHFL